VAGAPEPKRPDVFPSFKSAPSSIHYRLARINVTLEAPGIKRQLLNLECSRTWGQTLDSTEASLRKTSCHRLRTRQDGDYDRKRVAWPVGVNLQAPAVSSFRPRVEVHRAAVAMLIRTGTRLGKYGTLGFSPSPEAISTRMEP
jgi:hypothetical protein